MQGTFDDLAILVVDDSLLMRNLIRDLLENLGVRHIEIAENGSEALDILNKDKIDLVFCDWIMEPMNGLDLLASIRDTSTSPNPRLPVIMISSFGADFPFETAMEAGISEFLPKPLTAQALFQCLNRAQEASERT